ncbi:GSCOCG00011772001-RA-CDS, partial [Cotesia congregata]
WAEKRSKYSDNDIVIPYFFAGDDVEVNNPLSSHSSKKLEIALMIFTVRLYNELNVWKKNSYETSLSTGEKVYFVLDLIQGDNLGWHGLLGFTESFVATHYCRICKMKYTTMSYTKNYDVFIVIFRTIFFPCTDMKEKCVFNKIESFHCTKNYSVDGMHDVREGI